MFVVVQSCSGEDDDDDDGGDDEGPGPSFEVRFENP